MLNRKKSIVILGLVFLLGIIMNYIILPAHVASQVVLSVARISIIILLLTDGTFMRKPLVWRYTLALFVFLLGISFIMKLSHIRLANLFIIISFSGILITYLLHFVQKKVKNVLAILKVSWLFFYVGTIFFTLVKFPYTNEASIIELILFVAMYAMYAWENLRKETPASLN